MLHWGAEVGTLRLSPFGAVDRWHHNGAQVGSFVLQAVGATEWHIAPYARAEQTAPIVTTGGDMLFVPKGWWHFSKCVAPRCVTVVL